MKVHNQAHYHCGSLKLNTVGDVLGASVKIMSPKSSHIRDEKSDVFFSSPPFSHWLSTAPMWSYVLSTNGPHLGL